MAGSFLRSQMLIGAWESSRKSGRSDPGSSKSRDEKKLEPLKVLAAMLHHRRTGQHRQSRSKVYIRLPCPIFRNTVTPEPLSASFVCCRDQPGFCHYLHSLHDLAAYDSAAVTRCSFSSIVVSDASTTRLQLVVLSILPKVV